MPEPKFPYLSAFNSSEQVGGIFTDAHFAALADPSKADRGVLVESQAGLLQVAAALRDADRTDDVVATLSETAAALKPVRDQLAKMPDPEAVAASLLASIDGATSSSGGASAQSAARPALSSVRRPNAPRRRSVDGEQPVATLVASGGVELESMERLTEALVAAGRGLAQTGTGRTSVAELRTVYPARRMLGHDAAENAAKLDAAVSPAALTASGGICGPLQVDYSVPIFASDARPLRDGLPRFGADRGGVTFRRPPVLSTLAAATSVWTEATDASPGESTKAVASIVCADPVSVDVDAVPTRIQMGNFLAKFDPEWQQASVQTAMSAAARVAELNLLAKINTVSTETTATGYLGVTRELLATIDLVCAAERNRQRIGRSTMMRVVLFDWMRDMLRADLARELAHDRDGENNLAVTDAQIDAYLAVRGVSPIWMLDPLPAQGSGRTYPLQGFAAQSAGALVGWPASAVFYVFPEGSFVFLDGGRLDLGVIRDSTLSSTNDAEMFVEPFESVAFRGLESIKVIAPVLASGASAGTATPTTSSI